MALFPESSRKRIGSYKDPWERQLRLASGLLLQEMLNRYFPQKGLSLSDIRYTAHHKPFLPGSLYFSTTHSGNIAACIAAGYPIGIDTECNQSVDTALFRDYLTAEEEAAMAAAADKAALFYTLWTRKEAILKAAGHGLDTTALRDLCALSGKTWLGGQQYFTRPASLETGYTTHIAAPVRIKSVRIGKMCFI